MVTFLVQASKPESSLNLISDSNSDCISNYSDRLLNALSYSHYAKGRPKLEP